MKWVVLALLPMTAMAEEPMSGAAFEAYATGKTLTYAREGQVWGREQYLPGRKVIWAFEGEECRAGTWYEASDGLICFVYVDTPDSPQCWWFYGGAAGLTARSVSDPEGLPLAGLDETAKPLGCPGPALGV